MNILFLELSKIINNSTANIFDQKKIEGKVYNTNPEYIANVNKLVKQFDFYLVITSNQNDDRASVLYVLDQLGLDGKKVIDVLPYSQTPVDKMKAIQNWFASTRYPDFEYLILDNYENMQPSPDSNIFLVINGFSNSELEKATTRFQSILLASKARKEKETKQENVPSAQMGQASLEMTTLQNALTLSQTEAEQQTAEATYILNNNIELFRKKASHQSTYEARKELRKYILDKFPKANVEVIDSLLTRNRFIQSKDTMMYGVLPATVAGSGSIFAFTDLSILSAAACTIGLFVLLDLVSWLAVDSGTLKLHK